MSERTIINETLVPRLPRGVRLKNDKARGQWVVLAPERLFVLDDIANAVFQEIDGERTIAKIVDILAEKFQAPRDLISNDVIVLLQDFSDKGVLDA